MVVNATLVNATRPYSNSACELTRALVMYYIYTYLFILHIGVIGGVISIRDPYLCAVHEFVQRIARCLPQVRCLCSENVAIGFKTSIEAYFMGKKQR